MTLVLESDYEDYYDGAFDQPSGDGSDPLFLRRSDRVMPRLEMFGVIQARGLNVPRHGLGRVIDRIIYADDEIQLVVYPDRYRSDEPLRLIDRNEASNYPDAQIAERIGSSNGYYTRQGILVQSLVTRYIYIGSTRIRIEQSSEDDWRSNMGIMRSTVIEVMNNTHNPFMYPLIAVDMVGSAFGACCINLDTAPVLRGTGIEAHLPPERVVDLIKRAILGEDQSQSSQIFGINVPELYASIGAGSIADIPITRWLNSSTNATISYEPLSTLRYSRQIFGRDPDE